MKNLTDSGLGRALSDGQTLFAYLGSFWKHVYEDPDFIERFCEALGLLSVQLEQKKNEAMAVSSRVDVPVYSRERWLCVKLDPAALNQCEASKIEIVDSAPAIGAQGADASLPGAVPGIGFGGYPDGSAYYPVPKYVVSAASLHERVFDPEVSLQPGSDFEIKDGALVFRHEKDPRLDSRFRQSVDKDGIVVWLKDAMIDNNFVSDYLGYVVDMQLPSTFRNKDVINAFWDLLNLGATVSGVERFIQLVLDAGPGAVSVKAVVDLEDSSVLYLPRGFFADRLKYGLGFPDSLVRVERHQASPNGPWLYRFPLLGDPEDVDVFFSGLWRRCLEQNVDMGQLLGLDSDAEDLYISPKTFLLKNLIGANLVSVSIDVSKLSREVIDSLGLLVRLVDVFPVGACLVLTLHPGEIEEQYGCNTEDSADIVAGITISHAVSAISDSVVTFVVPKEEENNK